MQKTKASRNVPADWQVTSEVERERERDSMQSPEQNIM